MKRMLKAVGIVAGLLVLLHFAYVLAVWDRPDPRSAPYLSAPHNKATISRENTSSRSPGNATAVISPAHRTGALPRAAGGYSISDPPGGDRCVLRNEYHPRYRHGHRLLDGEIVQSIHEGIRSDRRILFPIIPSEKNLSDDDALAIVAYLRSIPAIRNPVHASQPAFVAKVLFDFNIVKPGPVIDKPIVAPRTGVTAEYGHYLATAAAGSADCHTPRDMKNGQFYFDSLSSGSSILNGSAEGDPLYSFARNFTPEANDGIGRWTE